MNPFWVVFIDLQGSSMAGEKRALLQQRLISLRDYLNKEYLSFMAMPFQVVWGDELKAVFLEPSRIWDMYRAVFSFMGTVPFYFSVGIGTIDTPEQFIKEHDINLVDGSSFKAARAGMDAAKEKSACHYRLSFATAGCAEYAAALNAFVDVMNDIVKHMTKSQRQQFNSMFAWHMPHEREQTEAVSRQAAWETLQRARVDAYKAAQTGLVKLLMVGAKAPDIVLPKGRA